MLGDGERDARELIREKILTRLERRVSIARYEIAGGTCNIATPFRTPLYPLRRRRRPHFHVNTRARASGDSRGRVKSLWLCRSYPSSFGAAIIRRGERGREKERDMSSIASMRRHGFRASALKGEKREEKRKRNF